MLKKSDKGAEISASSFKAPSNSLPAENTHHTTFTFIITSFTIR